MKLQVGVVALLLVTVTAAWSDHVTADPARETGGRTVAHRAGGKALEDGRTRRTRAQLFRVGQRAGEPTLGLTRDGTVFFVGFQDSLRVNVLRSEDAGHSWQDVSPQLAPEQNAHLISVDPYLYVDGHTDRVFTIDLTVACSYLSFSDDQGESWITNPLACGKPINDHQTLFAGPPVTSDPVGYDKIVYYCFNDFASSSCSKSLDGGITFIPTGEPAFWAVDVESDQPTRICGGMHGHGIVDKNGSIYLPREYCGGVYLAISHDEGRSWSRVKVAPRSRGEGGPGFDPSVDVDRDGNIYYGWVAPDRLPYLTLSRDGGKNWSKPVMIAAPHVTEVNLLTLDVASPGSVAFAYMGTEERSHPKAWHGYMGLTRGALRKDPVFYSATANAKSDPLKRGDCGPGRCGEVLDFIDIVIDRQGSPWAAFVDVCDIECARTGLSTQSNEGVVGRLVGGPSLRSPKR